VAALLRGVLRNYSNTNVGGGECHDTNTEVHTVDDFLTNRPDIIIENPRKKKRKTCTLIYVAIPADRNIMQKKAENKLNTRIYV
jgi:hypothetical protein